MCATPPPRPPSVNAGRTIAGTGNSTSGDVAMIECGTGRPTSCTVVAEELAILGAVDRAEVGADQLDARSAANDASSTARFSAVCPPSVGRIASGLSRSITSATVAASSGSR